VTVRVRSYVGWIAAALAVALATGAAPAAAADPCAAAAELVAKAQLDKAETQYLFLARRPASEACADQGLKNIAGTRKLAGQLVTQGDELRKHDPGQATALYRRALELDANDAKAKAGLVAILTSKEPSFLDKRKEQGEGWLEDLASLGVWLGGLLAWVGAGLVALMLVWRLARWLRRDGPKQLFRPRLTIEAFESAEDAKLDGAGAAAMLASRLANAGGRRGSVDQHVAAPEAADAWDEITKALGTFGPGKVASALLGLTRALLPRTALHIQGRILEGREGLGINLSIVEGRGTVMGSVDLWQRVYGPPIPAKDEEDGDGKAAALERLAAVGAVWLAHQCYALGVVSTLEGRPSDSWESDAFVVAGAEATGDPVAFRAELYARAITADPNNEAAVFNLGVLDLHGNRTDAATDRMKRVEEVCRRPVVPDASLPFGARADLLWFKAQYQLAVIELREGERKHAIAAYPYVKHLIIALDDASAAASTPVVLDRALPGRRRLADIAARLSAVIDGSGDDSESDGRRRRDLKSIHSSIVGMYSSMEVADPDDRGRRATELRRIEAPALALLADVLVLLWREPGAGLGAADLRMWRAELAGALKTVKGPDELRDVWPLRPAAIVDLLYRAPDIWRDVRTEYNLACYYTRVACLSEAKAARDAAADKALDFLGSSVAASASLPAWAKRDPSLQWLRDRRPAEFWPLVGGADPGADLAKLRAVGPDLATALAKQKIVDTKTLRDGLRTDDQQKQIAAALDVPYVLVRRWQGLAALCNIAGLTIDHANLLDEADVQTPEELAEMTPFELQRLMRHANNGNTTTEVPAVWVLGQWIAAAKNGAAPKRA
jgi:hypothetical protein